MALDPEIFADGTGNSLIDLGIISPRELLARIEQVCMLHLEIRIAGLSDVDAAERLELEPDDIRDIRGFQQIILQLADLDVPALRALRDKLPA